MRLAVPRLTHLIELWNWITAIEIVSKSFRRGFFKEIDFLMNVTKDPTAELCGSWKNPSRILEASRENRFKSYKLKQVCRYPAEDLLQENLQKSCPGQLDLFRKKVRSCSSQLRVQVQDETEWRKWRKRRKRSRRERPTPQRTATVDRDATVTTTTSWWNARSDVDGRLRSNPGVADLSFPSQTHKKKKYLEIFYYYIYKRESLFVCLPVCPL